MVSAEKGVYYCFIVLIDEVKRGRIYLFYSKFDCPGRIGVQEKTLLR